MGTPCITYVQTCEPVCSYALDRSGTVPCPSPMCLHITCPKTRLIQVCRLPDTFCYTVGRAAVSPCVCSLHLCRNADARGRSVHHHTPLASFPSLCNTCCTASTRRLRRGACDTRAVAAISSAECAAHQHPLPRCTICCSAAAHATALAAALHDTAGTADTLRATVRHASRPRASSGRSAAATRRGGRCRIVRAAGSRRPVARCGRC